ncbi:DUF3509 domain-containing protein [Pseudomonas duriflava]|nr:DUF3509 domain-containing protein [Pseudomonas duriflava]
MSAFSDYDCTVTNPRPDGSVVLCVKDTGSDAHITRVITARQLSEPKALQLVIDDMRKDVSLRAGALAPQCLATLRKTGATVVRYAE